MKHVLIYVLLFFAGATITLHAQETFCFTPAESENEEFNEIISKSANANTKLPPVNLRIYFHVIRRSNSTGGYLPWEVQQSLDILQTDFNPHGIFFEWDGCIDYIDNDSRYVWNTGGIFGVNNHADGIDVYLFPDSHNSAGGLANGVGSSSECWVAGSWNGDPVALTKIVSHEVGHCIFLWHTHHGCETGDWELIDGSNCAFTGDFVCDTPSDPFLAFNVDANCNWTGVAGCNPPQPVNQYMPDPEIIMAYTDPDCMAYFTPGQGQRMQFAIMQLPYLQQCVVGTIANDPCECPAVDLVFDEDIIIDQDLVVTGDLEIIDGAQVTITATVFFTQNHGIDMEENTKLLVDGGVLTSCEDSWRGIRTTGGNFDWDVTVTNGALIENTSEFAVSMLGPNPVPGQFGNGILLADNSTFSNTFGMVDFNAWNPTPNPSVINECTQNGGTLGVRNFNSMLIQITDNDFNDISQTCISAGTGGLVITGNDFDGEDFDILYNNASAGISSLVENNNFDGNDVGYRANGTTFAQNQIFNNFFTNPFVAVWNQGQNSYTIGNNSFTGQFVATASQDNGGGVCDLHNNDYSGNFAGLLTSGNNPVLNFFENCFQTSFSDVHIVNNVAPVIHNDQFRSAENCFTHNGVGPNSDLGGNPAGYFYLERFEKIDNCTNAINAHPNVTRFNFIKGDDSGCGAQEVEEPPVEVSICHPKRKISDAKNAFAELKDVIKQIENSDAYDDDEREILIAMYRRCLARVKNLLAELYVKGKAYDKARLCYVDEKTDDSKVAITSIYLMEGNLDKASDYLKSLKFPSENLTDFITTQKINIKSLPYGPLYVPKGSEKEILYEISVKNHDYAGYARALYYRFFGEMLNGEIDLEQGEKASNSALITQRDLAEPRVISYPNPFVAELNISLENIEHAQVSIQDFNGKTFFTNEDVTGNLSLNTSDWQSGIYLLTVKKGENVIKHSKLVLIK